MDPFANLRAEITALCLSHGIKNFFFIGCVSQSPNYWEFSATTQGDIKTTPGRAIALLAEHVKEVLPEKLFEVYEQKNGD